MQDEERQQAIAEVGKMFLKTQEILSMMKQGQFIIAYEKLGGVAKNLSALGAKLQQAERDQPQSV